MEVLWIIIYNFGYKVSVLWLVWDSDRSLRVNFLWVNLNWGGYVCVYKYVYMYGTWYRRVFIMFNILVLYVSFFKNMRVNFFLL